MRLLGTADLHIHNFSNFNTEWEQEVPGRLKNYERLADEILVIAKAKKVDAIVVAGDLCVNATTPPMVHTTIKNLLKKLGQKYPILVTHGQHDLEHREATNLAYNSLVSLFADLKNVHYVHDNIFSFKRFPDTKFYVRGWTRNPDLKFKKADIFVGHDIVSSSSNHDGYVFRAGYSPKFLAERYDVSIVGDVHKKQIIKDIILVPGCPIQKDFRDDPETGVWIIDYEKGKKPKFEFVEIINETFPKFIKLDEDEAAPSKYTNVHIRRKKKKIIRVKDEDQIVDTETIGKDSLNLIVEKLIKEHGEELPDQEFKEIMDLASELLESADIIQDSGRFQKVVLKKAVIQGFLTVEDMVFEFPESNSNQILFQGENGIGKTSVLEFVGFMIFDMISKFLGAHKGELTKTDIINYNHPKKGTYGELYLEVNGTEFKIIRAINHKTHKTCWYVENHLKKSARISDTKEFLQNLLGMSEDDFFLLTYFSQKKFSFFTDLSANYQIEIIKRLSNCGLVDAIVAEIASRISEDKAEIAQLSVKIDTLSKYKEKMSEAKQYDTFKTEIEKAYPDINFDEDIASQLLDIVNKKYPKIEITSFDLYFRKHDRADLDFDNAKLNYQKSKDKLKTIKKNCYTCGKPWTKAEIKDVTDRLTEKAVDASRIQVEKAVVKNDLEEAHKEVTALQSICQKYNTLRQIFNMCKTVKEDEETAKEEMDILKIKLKNLLFLKSNVYSTKGVYAFVLKSVGDEIQNEVNEILADSEFKVKLSTASSTVGGKIKPGLDVKVSKHDGPYQKYPMLSGGESRVIDLALMVGINNKFIDKRGDLLGIIFLDEVYQFIDTKHLEMSRDLLNFLKVSKQIVVTHESRLHPLFDTIVQFSKGKNGVKAERIQ